MKYVEKKKDHLRTDSEDVIYSYKEYETKYTHFFCIYVTVKLIDIWSDK